MKVLTLHQPWASLIALGVKTIETRSWRAPSSLIGERIAIHAALSPAFDAAGGIGIWRVVYDALRSSGAGCERCSHPAGMHVCMFTTTSCLRCGCDSWRPPIPLGAIVCTAVVTDCLPMVDGNHPTGPRWEPSPIPCIDIASDPHTGYDRLTQWWHHDGGFRDVTAQLPYGDFRPGRWAWMLSDIEPLAELCPACRRPPRDDGMVQVDATHIVPRAYVTDKEHCILCDDTGRCEPVPFKGGQGLSREWATP